MPSTVVKSFHYDTGHAVLRVTFVSGTIYEYRNVPPEVYEAMKAAFSKGTFLNTHVKGHFNYKKVN